MTEPEYQIRRTPLMKPEAVARLRDLMGGARCFLEYGAGGSTMMAGEVGVPLIFSVESDAKFLAAVEETFALSGTQSKLHTHHADIGTTKEWGHPSGFAALRQWPAYASGIWEVIRRNKAMPDLVLVDGRFRVACMLATALHVHPGTPVWLDDYADREAKYAPVHRHLKFVETVGTGALFETVPFDHRELAVDLARFSIVAD
jgi:hypothetical protein